jgi:5-methylcytosine-specific restriction endonuclease McrA
MARAGGGSAWIWPTTRLALYLRDGFQCKACGKDLHTARPRDITLDHLTPYSVWEKMSPAEQDVFGNPHDASNLVTMCNFCNCSRQDAPWRTWYSAEGQARVEAALALPPQTELARAIRAGRVGDPRLEMREID